MRNSMVIIVKCSIFGPKNRFSTSFSRIFQFLVLLNVIGFCSKTQNKIETCSKIDFQAKKLKILGSNYEKIAQKMYFQAFLSKTSIAIEFLMKFYVVMYLLLLKIGPFLRFFQKRSKCEKVTFPAGILLSNISEKVDF